MQSEGELKLVDLDLHRHGSQEPCLPMDSPYEGFSTVKGHSNESANSFDTPSLAAEVICSGCGYGIKDRYMLKVMEEMWHEACLRCSACQRPLAANNTCYSKDGHVYCREDHSLCGRCHQTLQPTDVVFRCLHSTYHAHCFTCFFCQQPFQKGDEYMVIDGQIVCRAHSFPPQPPVPNPFFSVQHAPHDPNEKSKRPRTILNAQQRRQFKNAFEKSAKPCRKVREQLAKETGLSVRVVQVWFQNQRAKVKKAQRKMEMSQASGGGDSEGKGSLDENKSESDEGTVDSDTEDLDQENNEKTQNPIAKLYHMQHAYFTNPY